MQAVVEGLFDQRVIGDFTFTDHILQACDLVGEHGRDQVFTFHPLYLRRDLTSSDVARQGQGDTGIPAPTDAKQWRIEYGLDQQMLGAVGVQITPDLIQLEAVAGR